MMADTERKGGALWIVAAVAAVVVVPLLAFGVQSGRCVDLAHGAESSCTMGPTVGVPGAWLLTLAAVGFAAYAGTRAGRRAAVTMLVTVLAVALGLGISAFGFLGWSTGPLVLLVGIIGRSTCLSWARWVVWAGIGLTLGALLYIGLGLLIPDGPSTGGGSGTSG